MRALDIVLALLAIASFILYLGILAYYVPQTDLLIVLAIGVVMAVYDFARSFFTLRRGHSAAADPNHPA